MAACQPASLRTNCHAPPLSSRSRQVGRPAASAARALQQPGRQQEQRDAAPGVAATAPKVGWLWDKKAADTRKRLKDQNIRPKKSLGQNFMLDDAVLSSIVAAAEVQPGDLVLEIGPGTGNLTRYLLEAGALVTAVEKDAVLTEQLRQEFAQIPQLQLVCGDILHQDMGRLLASMQQHQQQCGQAQPGQGQQAQQQEQQQLASIGSSTPDGAGREQQDVQQPAAGQQQQQGEQQPAGEQQQQQQPAARVKVVANLPYYITKDCLTQMLPLGASISHLYFMLQDEVGVRLTQVQPGGPDWRAMNILTQYYSQAEYLFQIDCRKYLPVPKVHGAVLLFQLLPSEQRLAVPSESGFLKLVKKAFSQRRKVVRNALRPLHEPADVVAALVAAGLSKDARAQDLTLHQFGDLAWRLLAAKEGQAEQAGEMQQAGDEGEEEEDEDEEEQYGAVPQ